MTGAVAAVVVVGSNVDRDVNVPEAIRRLRRHPDLAVDDVSRVFESAAVGGPPDAPDFYNAAVLVTTSLPPEDLRTALRAVEAAMGRERTEDRNAPRPIDLDLVLYGEVVDTGPGWELPDPSLLVDAHVAVPVADVVPDWRHPVTGATTYEVREGIPSAEQVHPVMTINIERPHRSRGPEDFDGVVQVYAPRLEALVRGQLVELGEDPDREGLQRTPLRVAKALDYLTSGYSGSLAEVVNGAIFDAEGAEEMVLVKDIEFYSLCEHHMLPFFGRAAVGYLPKGKIIGLSKVARIVDLYARRLQVQERMTNQIADALGEVLSPHGVAVVVEGRHFCMMMRGVQKQDSSMVTSAMRGTFRSDARTRNEFLDLVRR